MIVYKFIDKFVDLIFEIVDRLINNKSFRLFLMLNNGYKNVFIFFIDLIGVDKNNINDMVIKDNFYIWEEVYIVK